MQRDPLSKAVKGGLRETLRKIAEGRPLQLPEGVSPKKIQEMAKLLAAILYSSQVIKTELTQFILSHVRLLVKFHNKEVEIEQIHKSYDKGNDIGLKKEEIIAINLVVLNLKREGLLQELVDGMKGQLKEDTD